MKPLVIRSALVASLGGLIFGFDTAVISGTTDSLKRVFELDDGGLGFTVTTALLGTIVGALTAGKPADRYGRRTISSRSASSTWSVPWGRPSPIATCCS